MSRFERPTDAAVISTTVPRRGGGGPADWLPGPASNSRAACRRHEWGWVIDIRPPGTLRGCKVGGDGPCKSEPAGTADVRPGGPRAASLGRDFRPWGRGTATAKIGSMPSAKESIGPASEPVRSLRQLVPEARHAELQDPAAGNGMRRGAPQAILVDTKLHPPRVREQSIPRERLLERLRTGSGRRLTLIACPAGFGKTTLLAVWHVGEAARKPVAWLTLDEGDNDPVVLWSHAIGALCRASPAVARSASELRVVAPVVDVVLPGLVNELDGQGEIMLILDDFHRVSSVAARASVRWFIEHAPPSSSS